jgi:hypothetical protein
MTAAARLRHSARRVLPAVMSYVGHGEEDDVLFSTIEYTYFRDFLAPASGFQTAQLRLIQRALGKTPLLALRVFPGDSYGQPTAAAPWATSPSATRSCCGGPRQRLPRRGDPAHVVTRLDELAHAVLARLAPNAAGRPQPPSVRMVLPDDVDRAATRVRATLGDHPDADQLAAAFREDLEAAASGENERRAALGDARRGAQALHELSPHTCLSFILDRIAATDAALHAPAPDSFLTVHRKAVRRHVADDGGPAAAACRIWSPASASCSPSSRPSSPTPIWAPPAPTRTASAGRAPLAPQPSACARSMSTVSTACRRCGITIEPPTTSATFIASSSSSSDQPASTHWIRW